MTNQLAQVFAYGTLKNGQCRQHYWAHRPREVALGWIHGALFDTGPYPALDVGDDLVAGELWMFEDDQIDEILHVLDDEEGYYGPASSANLYTRRIVTCETQDGRTLDAHAYFYTRRSEFPTFRRLHPNVQWNHRHFAIWPTGGKW